MPALRPLLALVVVLASACGGGERAASQGDSARAAADDVPVTVYVAASLAAPMREALGAYGRARGVPVAMESGGSLEHARKVTELGRIPDLLVLADHEVFPTLLAPRHVQWWVRFARNRMVIAWTPRSRHAAEMDSARWREILGRPGVEVGRTDPATAPAGYRTLLLLRLAARHYDDPTLEARILANAPPRNVRPNAAELVALLEAGELDYIVEYESLARAHGLRYLALPPQVDLGDPARESQYAAVSLRIPGRSTADSLTVRGGAILFALGVPGEAPNRAHGEGLAEFLLRGAGRRIFREAGIDLLPVPTLVGQGAPESVRSFPAP